jgi:xyloglucan 6-xylosyltransferase
MKVAPNINTTFKRKPQMLLITNSQPTHYKNPSKIIICLRELGQDQSYCHFHNIKIFYNMTHLNKEMVGISTKLELLEQLMFGHLQVEWIWWMDKTPCSQICY